MVTRGGSIDPRVYVDATGQPYVVFNQPGYSIGVARCAGPLGPCSDVSPSPLLASNVQGEDPGEESAFADAAGLWLVYTPSRSTLPLPGPPRPVAMAHLGFGPAGPCLAAPLDVRDRPELRSTLLLTCG